MLKKLENLIEQFKRQFYADARKIGTAEVSRRCGKGEGYISKVINEKKPVSLEKMIEIYKRL